jgi:hypothetical protein
MSSRIAIGRIIVAAVVGIGIVVPAGSEAVASTDPVIDAQMLVYEINRARANPAAFAAEAGVALPAETVPAPPLAIDPRLASSATFKANEIATNGYFGHQSAVTGVWPNRLARDHAFPLPSEWSDGANNIESLHSGSPSPFNVLLSFFNSPSHRRHLFAESAFFLSHNVVGVGRSSTANVWAVHTAYASTTDRFITGVVYADLDGNGRMNLGEGLGGVTVSAGGSSTTTNAGGGYAIQVGTGTHTVTVAGGPFVGQSSRTVTVGGHNVGVDFVSGAGTVAVAASGSGWGTTTVASACPSGTTCDTITLVDDGGVWRRLSAPAPGATVNAFYYGNPGDMPFAGDWDGTGTATPGLYRQRDGFAYLRQSNTQGTADIRFFFGNSGDRPLVGDFNGDGRDTVSVYRSHEARVYVIDRLGADDSGLGAADYSYLLGNPGDIPFVGDFDGDGVDTVGLYRPSTGWVYLRNAHSAGPATTAFFIGTGWTSVFAGDWDGNGVDTVGAYSRSTGRVFLGLSNSAVTSGVAMHVGSHSAVIPAGRG